MSFSNCELFYEGWRFEECAELTKEINSGEIVFFNEKQSSILWSIFVSQKCKHMMKMNMDEFSKIERYDVSFENKNSAGDLFSQFEKMAGKPLNALVFFGEKYLCSTPFYLLKKYWDHFFLPSDENTVVIAGDNKYFIFSYEERFFLVTR